MKRINIGQLLCCSHGPIQHTCFCSKLPLALLRMAQSLDCHSTLKSHADLSLFLSPPPSSLFLTSTVLHLPSQVVRVAVNLHQFDWALLSKQNWEQNSWKGLQGHSKGTCLQTTATTCKSNYCEIQAVDKTSCWTCAPAGIQQSKWPLAKKQSIPVKKCGEDNLIGTLETVLHSFCRLHYWT